jgi:non-ribosomal peptide synthetase component E (peptide arylation enzyme)
MTELVTVKLPDEVARRARQAGLLSDAAIQMLLEDAMRRAAGRDLLEAARQLQSAGVQAMSDEALMAEVRAARIAASSAR